MCVYKSVISYVFFCITAPYAPQNFRVTAENATGMNRIRYVLEWDIIVPGVSYEYEVEFSVIPRQVSRQNSIVSPMWIILNATTEYEVTLRFRNCAGSNSSTLHLITSEHYYSSISMHWDSKEGL